MDPHCAYSVTVTPSTSVRSETFSQSSYIFGSVPFRFRFQPANTYPSRLNSFFVRFWGTPYSNVWSGIVPVPLWASNLTVYLFGLHCANSVTVSSSSVDILEPVTPSAYESPEPSGSVFHATNVWA